MKLTPVWLALIIGAGSCQKKSDPVPPTLAGGTWSLQTESVLYTPKSGGLATTHPRHIAPGEITYSFSADGKVVLVASGVVTTSTYTYSGNVITIPLTANGLPPLVLQVTQLADHQLTTVEKHEDNDYAYDDTTVFTR